MLGSDQVDVVAPPALQVEHDPRQIFRPDFHAGVGLADVVVLAEDAAKIAAGEKDGAAAVPSAQAVLLAVVGSEARHASPPAHPAHAAIVFEAIDSAGPGAQPALGQTTERLLHPPRQLPALMQANVAGRCGLGAIRR